MKRENRGNFWGYTENDKIDKTLLSEDDFRWMVDSTLDDIFSQLEVQKMDLKGFKRQIFDLMESRNEFLQSLLERVQALEKAVVQVNGKEFADFYPRRDQDMEYSKSARREFDPGYFPSEMIWSFLPETIWKLRVVNNRVVGYWVTDNSFNEEINSYPVLITTLPEGVHYRMEIRE